MANIASFLITFRESLEAALVVGIILAYLTRTKSKGYIRFVYLGVCAGVLASYLAAGLFSSIAGGFEGRNEELFGGAITIIGSIMMTFMILWMMNQRNVRKDIESSVQGRIDKGYVLGLFMLVFISVLREGIETVLFLGAAGIAEGGGTYPGAILGIAAAIAVGYLLFSGILKINMKMIFGVTSIFLMLFAAGLLSHGVHELQEAGVLPELVAHVWNLNPPVNADGTFPLLHEDGEIGGFAKSIFGYSGSPSLLEVLAYLGYLIVISGIFYRKTMSVTVQKEVRG